MSTCKLPSRYTKYPAISVEKTFLDFKFTEYFQRALTYRFLRDLYVTRVNALLPIGSSIFFEKIIILS